MAVALGVDTDCQDGAREAVRAALSRVLPDPARTPVTATPSSHLRLGIPLLVLALGYTVALFALSVAQHSFGADYVSGPWIAGRDVLHGITPYISPRGRGFASGIFFDYPAFAAFATAPLSVLPASLAAAIMATASICGVLLALRLVGVRDLRVYATVLLWPPVIMGWQFANPSLLLLLGVAVCWRYRDRAAVIGITLAVMISLKVFLWPLLVWLIATRRRTAVAYVVATTMVLNLVSWGIVGFSQIPRFLTLIRAEVSSVEIRGSGLVALLQAHGASSTAAHAAIVIVALVCGVAAVRLGRAGNDHASFTLAIGVALIATPLLWPHYYALLAVPLAIAVPRLAYVWGLPFLMLPAVVIPTWTPLLPSLKTIPALYPNSWPIWMCVGVAAALTLFVVSRSAAVSQAPP